jgi:uncharacterized protein (DUF305 family)
MSTPARASRNRGQILRRALAATTSGAVFLLLGCSDGSPSGDGDAAAPTATPRGVAANFNHADVHFARSMVPQNDQAVEMCKMVLAKRGVKTEVRDLAEQIKKVQEPQMEVMSRWNDTWNQMPGQGDETDDEGPAHHGDENGLMSEEQMKELDTTDGSTAQRLFMEGMIRHHQGAVVIAEAEARAGIYKDAVQLAKDMVATQKAEIVAMQHVLSQL